MRNGLNNIQWCPGCGDFLALAATKNAFKELDIASHNRVVVSGVGCSGKFSQYIDGYGAETLHGRSIPFSTGVKLANPELTVVTVAGDGDTYGIGMGHFIHACKRNLDMTMIVLNNENYALTTGQASPTTPIGAKTKTTPAGNTSTPMDTISLAKSAGVGFIRKVDTLNPNDLKDAIKEAINYPGFAVIDFAQPCPSFKRW